MNQTKRYIDFFRAAEKQRNNWKIGAEFEHFIIRKDLTAVGYYEDSGIAAILKELNQKYSWEAEYEDEYLLALKNPEATITLEPAGQIEISIAPQKSLEKISLIYQRVIKQIIKIIDQYEYLIVACGYQPKSQIKQLQILPKHRYKLMFDYFKTKGKSAHNMMKGTASIQVAVDYSSEEDFVNKMRLGYQLSPLIALLFDNSYSFEGKPFAANALRQQIWRDCDLDRCGTIPGLFSDDFGYKAYAEYVLSIPPIFIETVDGKLKKWEKPLREIYSNSWTKQQFQHTLSMHFPDVRARNYIEFRIADALPYPLNMGLIKLYKTIFYNETIFDKCLALFADIDNSQIDLAITAICQKGFFAEYADKPIVHYFDKIKAFIETQDLVDEYLSPILDLIDKRQSYKQNLNARFNNEIEIYNFLALNKILGD